MRELGSFVEQAAALPLGDCGGFRARFAELAEAGGARAPRDVCGDMIRLIDELLAAEESNLRPAETDALYALRDDLWDEQIERDAQSGALDHLIAESRAEEARRKKSRLTEAAGYEQER